MGFRILHSITSVNPAGGGPIEGLKQLAAVNTEHGHSVEVISLDDPASPWVEACPVRCHAMGPSSPIYHYSPRFVPWLRAHRHEYDVVIVNGLWQFTSFASWLALRNTPTPYFVFAHGMLDPWFKRQYPMKHLKKWLYWPWAEYRVLRDATAVLFTCEEERRLARRSFWLYKCDEFVVNYGTSAPTGNPEAQRALFLERYPHLRDKRCLLFLGRVHEKKGPDLLFRAFAALLDRLPPEHRRGLHIVMAGPDDHAFGREMKDLVATLGLSERVTWTGMLSGDLKWGAFHAADAFVLTSHQENFGIAVVEALACGVPVLISSQVNIWREIRQAGAGFVESDDAAGAERLLEQWIYVDGALWKRMRGAARKVFAERFVIDRAADSFIRAMKIHGLRTVDAP
jgi:glycosyltransferase involved in cell wall biosynthesis